MYRKLKIFTQKNLTVMHIITKRDNEVLTIEIPKQRALPKLKPLTFKKQKACKKEHEERNEDE
jgi:hypothetical protein